jgi:uncharacterized protein YgbK (DUF1537 family)
VPERWLIVADDLTGAADAGVPFARRGLKTKVLLPNAQLVDPETVAVAYDADTRRSSATQAGLRHAQAVVRFGAPDTSLYKKIDSTLRGHPAIEIAAMREVLAEQRRETFGVLAPAFPAMGRTTRDGHVLVNGKPLEESETWAREHSYPDADLGRILASAGVESVKVPLARVRSGAAALGELLAAMARERKRGFGLVAICDAETDEDLDNIACAARASTAHGFLIGTAGLAHAVARTAPERSCTPLAATISGAGALIVVGSLASATRHATRELAAKRGVLPLCVESALLRDASRRESLRATLAAAGRALETGDDVLVELAEDVAPDLGRGLELVRALACGLKDALERMSGLIVTGGETAAALLAQVFIDEFELAGEIEPGVALGLARNHIEFPLVTKPGAFGDSGSLVRALERLRTIRRTGIVA